MTSFRFEYFVTSLGLNSQEQRPRCTSASPRARIRDVIVTQDLKSTSNWTARQPPPPHRGPFSAGNKSHRILPSPLHSSQMDANSTMNTSSSTNGTNEKSISLIFYLSGVSFVGVLLNTLVIFVVLRPSVIPGRIPLTFLLDQLVGEWLTSLVHGLSWLTAGEFWVPDSGWGTLTCKFLYADGLKSGIMRSTTTNLLLLTAERYVMIVHPMLHDKFTPTVNAVAIFLSWATGFAISTGEFLMAGRSGTSCAIIPTDLKTISIVVVVWTAVFCFSTMACLNARLLSVLKQQTQKRKTLGSDGSTAVNPAAAYRKKLQRQMAYSVGIVYLSLTAASCPPAVVYLMMTFGPYRKLDFRSPLFQGTVTIVNTFFIINPLICIYMLQSVRREVVALVTCGRRDTRPDSSTVPAKTMSSVV